MSITRKRYYKDMSQETSPNPELESSVEPERIKAKDEQPYDDAGEQLGDEFGDEFGDDANKVNPTVDQDEEEITATQSSYETDPNSFTFRDLLLLTQILHTLGLIEPSQLRSSPLDEHAQTWFAHKCTVLSRRQGEFPLSQPPTGEQILELYEKMLVNYSPCKDTTELANCFYHLRIKDLESKIAHEKAQFETLHNIA